MTDSSTHPSSEIPRYPEMSKQRRASPSWAWMKKRDWDTLEYLFSMPFLRPEMAKALHYYLEYDPLNESQRMDVPVDYVANLEAARSVIAALAGASPSPKGDQE